MLNYLKVSISISWNIWMIISNYLTLTTSWVIRLNNLWYWGQLRSYCKKIWLVSWSFIRKKHWFWRNQIFLFIDILLGKLSIGANWLRRLGTIYWNRNNRPGFLILFRILHQRRRSLFLWGKEAIKLRDIQLSIHWQSSRNRCQICCWSWN